MSEIAGALNLLGSITTCQTIQYPSGRWGFVGLVPIELSYIQLNGDPPTAEQANDIRKFGPGLVRSCKRRAWDTEELALEALRLFQEREAQRQ